MRGPPREQPRASSPRFYPKVTRLRSLPSPATRLFPPTCVGRDAKCDDELETAGSVNHRWPVFRSSLWASKSLQTDLWTEKSAPAGRMKTRQPDCAVRFHWRGEPSVPI